MEKFKNKEKYNNKNKLQIKNNPLNNKFIKEIILKGFDWKDDKISFLLRDELELYGYWNVLGIYKNLFAKVQWENHPFNLKYNNKKELKFESQKNQNNSFWIERNFFNIFKEYRKNNTKYFQAYLDDIWKHYNIQEKIKNQTFNFITNFENQLRYKIALFLEQSRNFINKKYKQKFKEKDWLKVLKKILEYNNDINHTNSIKKFIKNYLLKHDKNYQKKNIWFSSRFFSINDIKTIISKIFDLNKKYPNEIIFKEVYKILKKVLTPNLNKELNIPKVINTLSFLQKIRNSIFHSNNIYDFLDVERHKKLYNIWKNDQKIIINIEMVRTPEKPNNFKIITKKEWFFLITNFVIKITYSSGKTKILENIIKNEFEDLYWLYKEIG